MFLQCVGVPTEGAVTNANRLERARADATGELRSQVSMKNKFELFCVSSEPL